MHIDFEYFRVFYEVAIRSSITRAAEDLYTSQSSITRTIQRLEAQVGQRLFARTAKGMVLSPCGKLLFDEIEEACRKLISAERRLSDGADGKDNLIRIGANAVISRIYLMPCIDTFTKRYPKVKFKIENCTFSEAQQMLMEGKIDFAMPGVSVKPGHALKMGGGISCNMLLTGHPEMQDMAVVGRKYAFLAGRALTLEELNRYPLVVLRKGDFFHDYYEELFHSHGLKMEPFCEVSSLASQISTVIDGAGYCFAPMTVTEPYLKNGSLLHLDLKAELASGDGAVFTSRLNPPGGMSRAFISLVARESVALAEGCMPAANVYENREMDVMTVIQ